MEIPLFFLLGVIVGAISVVVYMRSIGYIFDNSKEHGRHIRFVGWDKNK